MKSRGAIIIMSINNNDIESLIINPLRQKKTINALYRPPNGQRESFEKFLNNIFSKIKKSNKLFHIAGDFNLNLLDHDTNRKVQRFLNIKWNDSNNKQTNWSYTKNDNRNRPYSHKLFH